MRAIRTVESNCTYTGPTPEIADLPVKRDGEGTVYGVFALSDEERHWIANGAQVQIGICQEPMPPISVAIVNLEESEGGEGDKDYRCGSCDGLYIERRAVELAYKCGWCGGELELPSPRVAV